MELVDFEIDWHGWFERWEQMQNCYIPQRIHRFDLMLKSADLPRRGDLEILDLGCGPGSLAFQALRQYPNAHIVAADFDPILLTMGQKEAEQTTDRIDFVQADIRQGKFWRAYRNTFDLIMSATALHWLNAANLALTYKRSYKALKPGGWLMNSDHVSSDDPETQGRYRQILRARQETAFRQSQADDWNGFWDDLGLKVGRDDLTALQNADEYIRSH